jgi:DNA-binding transcriptional LysR family regulator
LALFCEVARRSSFIAAAQATGISPAHVSKRIAMLEQALGVKLFQRTTRRVGITADRLLCAAPAYLQQRGTPKTLAELAQHDCLLFRERDQRFGVWRLHGPHGEESVKVTGPMASNHIARPAR